MGRCGAGVGRWHGIWRRSALLPGTPGKAVPVYGTQRRYIGAIACSAHNLPWIHESTVDAVASGVRIQIKSGGPKRYQLPKNPWRDEVRAPARG